MMRVVLLLSLLGVLPLFVGCAASPGGQTAWIDRQGGVKNDAAQARAEQVLSRLIAGQPQIHVKVQVLGSQGVCAYVWPDGSVFVTAGLLARVDDDLLAAALAHELGHLLSDGRIDTVASLKGYSRATDAECRADAYGVALLKLQHLPPQSMPAMIRLVRDANVLSPMGYQAMTRRVQILDSSRLGISAAH